MAAGNRSSDLQRAKAFLEKSLPMAFTPDRVKELLGLKISVATLGRKFRAAAVGIAGKPPELIRSYYRNGAHEDIAQYAYNPVCRYYCQAPAARPEERVVQDPLLAGL